MGVYMSYPRSMRARRLLAQFLLIGSACVGVLTLVYSWKAFSTWRMLASMGAAQRAEWIDICRTPSMDCEPDPTAWLRLVVIFGVTALAMAICSRLVAFTRRPPSKLGPSC